MATLPAMWKGERDWAVFRYAQSRAPVANIPASNELVAVGGRVLTDDQLYNFWTYRDCMPAIQAGDIRGQFISAARAAIAASGLNAALVEALQRIVRQESAVHDEELGEMVMVCMDAEEMVDIARAALAAAGAGESK